MAVRTQLRREQEYLRLGDIIGPGGLLPVSRATFYSLIAKGVMPRPIKVGRASLWRRSEINTAIEALQS